MQRPTSALFSMLAGSCLAFTACGGDDAPAPADNAGSDGTTSTSGSGGSGGEASTGIGGGAGPGGGPPDGQERATITGDATWDVTFDATAQAAGATDCSYTRHYVGVEDESAPWVCPQCEVIFRADVEMTAGADCYATVSMNPPAPEEWIGYGGGVWYRGIAFTTDQGTATIDAGTVVTSNVVMDLDHTPSGGKMAFAVSGSYTLGTEEGDPVHGFTPPATYGCGWPKADPPPYTGDYLVAMGATLPDGVFLDACNEPVRLHDFAGSYLIVDMAARDCPPCQLMASQEEAFVADMKAQGIDVHVVTLMAPSLADPLGETTKSMLDGWIGNYDLKSPVLADRAWGLSMFIPIFGDMVGYPSWVLVDPELKVMNFGSGFGSFDEMEAAIAADAP